MSEQCKIGGRRRQRGAALFVSLTILLIMTLIGLTSMQSTTLEEQMAGNTRDRHLAFEAAEAAMEGAEDFIENNVIAIGFFDGDGTDGLYDDSIEDLWKSVDWDGTDTGNDNEAQSYATFDNTYKIKTSPKYVIQHYATVVSDVDQLNLDNYGQGTGAGETELFRVTVRGTGGSDNAVVMLQSTYGKRL